MKKMLSALMAGLLMLTLAGCGAAGGAKMDLGTGEETGVYFSYGQALSQVLPDSSGIQIVPVITDGSKANIQAIHQGELQLGLVQSDVMTYAWQGRRSFQQEGRMDTFRVVAGLYAECVQLITIDPEIREVDDLKGKRISVGSEGSGVFFSAFDVQDAAGITMNDIVPVYEDFAGSTQALKDRKIDAAFIVAGIPTPAVTELCRNDAAYLVPIDQITRKRLLDACPFYTVCTIPAGTYIGQTEDVETVGVTATLVAAADVPEADIYSLTEALFENRSAISAIHGKGLDLDLQKAAEIQTAPFHPGARRYYRDQGIELK